MIETTNLVVSTNMLHILPPHLKPIILNFFFQLFLATTRLYRARLKNTKRFVQ